MLPVLDLNPTIEPTAAVGAVTVLRDQPFEAELAGMPEQVRSDLTLLERRNVNAVDPPGQDTGQVGLAQRQGQAAEVVALGGQAVEGVELYLGIALAAVQAAEVGDTVSIEQHGLAIEHERRVAVAQCGLDDAGIAIGPVMAVAGEQPHALVLALDDQAIAVMLDFVDPVGAVGDFGSLGGKARFKGCGHGVQIVARPPQCESIVSDSHACHRTLARVLLLNQRWGDFRASVLSHRRARPTYSAGSGVVR
jgi:hypothetical protein